MTRIGITHDTPTPLGDCAGTDLHLTRVWEALSDLGHVVSLTIDKELSERLHGNDVEIVFNMARGGAGAYERFHVAELFEHFSVPFTGGSASAQSVTGSRVRLSEVLRQHDVPIASFTTISSAPQLETLARRRFPLAVVPSDGLPQGRNRAIARDFGELEQLANARFAESSMLSVEAHADGARFSCLLLGNGRSRTMLPPVAVDDSSRSEAGSAPVMERIPVGMLEELEGVARRAADAVGCRDAALVEVGLTEGGFPTVVGVDPLPLLGCTRSDDVVTIAATAAGLSVGEIVQRCLLAAAERSHLLLPRAPVLARLPRFTPPRGLPAFTSRPPA